MVPHIRRVVVRNHVSLDWDDAAADYGFEIFDEPGKGPSIVHEHCVVKTGRRTRESFEVRQGVFVETIPGIRPQVTPGRLALYAASATEEYRPVYDFLAGMRFHSLDAQSLRESRPRGSGEVLHRRGTNAAAVLRTIQDKRPESYERLCRLLGRAVEGVRAVGSRTIGSEESLYFEQEWDADTSWTLDALGMSDGTLSFLGLLLALYQPGHPSVVGIEEPESTIHPASAEVLSDVLADAAHEEQILVTSHSPELLEGKLVEDDQVQVVYLRGGRTLIAPPSSSTLTAMREGLYTLGELLRTDELLPDTELAHCV